MAVYCVIFFLRDCFAKLKFSEMQGRHTAIESILKKCRRDPVDLGLCGILILESKPDLTFTWKSIDTGCI